MRYLTEIRNVPSESSNWIEFAADGVIDRVHIAATVAVGQDMDPSVYDRFVQVVASLSKDIPGGNQNFSVMDQPDIVAVLLIGVQMQRYMDNEVSGSFPTTSDGVLLQDYKDPIYVKKGERLYIHVVHKILNVDIAVTALMTVFTSEK